jgi:putative ABC transport system ATP-binding protein
MNTTFKSSPLVADQSKDQNNLRRVEGVVDSEKSKVNPSNEFQPAVSTLIKAKPNIKDPTDHIIKMEKIEKYYTVGKENQLIIKGVDIDIVRGETIALLGKSGSGKSTMLNILGLLDFPTGGRYFLNNKDVTLYNERERSIIRNQTFGFIFQQFNLLQKLTVIDNVTAPLYYSADRSKWRNRNRIGMELLEKFGIADQANKMPKLLSGGQQQRVAMARSLVNDPDIIIGDEPTGALDSKTTDQVMTEIFRLNSEFNKTVIFVTHDDDLATKFSRVIHLVDGLIDGQ